MKGSSYLVESGFSFLTPAVLAEDGEKNFRRTFVRHIPVGATPTGSSMSHGVEEKENGSASRGAGVCRLGEHPNAHPEKNSKPPWGVAEKIKKKGGSPLRRRFSFLSPARRQASGRNSSSP